MGMKGYMPNYHGGAYEFTSRRDLAEFIKGELRSFNIPVRRFRDVKLRRLWGFIARHGSSTAHFSLDAGNGEYLEFHGLTEDEFKQMSEQEG